MKVSRHATGAAAGAAIAGFGLLISGCAQIRDHKGYVADSALIDTVAPGVDTRDSVTKTLGRPSFVSEFDGGGNWYYLSRETRQYAFNNPHATAQTLLVVRFAGNGEVAAVQKTGLETIRKVAPYGKTTPTLGRHTSFIGSLFGNIGAGGANARRAPSQDNPGGSNGQ